MKLIKLFLFIFILCLVFPVASKADQYEDATRAFADKDYKKATELLSALTEENNLAAKTLLGTMYFKGEGIDRDINKGLAMIMDAASQGYAQARFISVALNKEIADLGDVKAMYNMGYMCLKGWGGEHDSGQCIRWLEIAAGQGHEKSAKILSQIYSKGKFGIAPDADKASYWSNMVKK